MDSIDKRQYLKTTFKQIYESSNIKVFLCSNCGKIKKIDYSKAILSSCGSSGPSISPDMMCYCKFKKRNNRYEKFN